MARRGEFYAGSQLLQGLVPVVGLPLDQLNFLVCQLLGLLLAVPFRLLLAPGKVGPQVRLVVELVLGLALAFFCFGHQVWYLVGQSLVSYLLMRFGGPKWSQLAVFIYCMAYLSLAHILRQFYDYGGYTLDITGPMMIQTQKLTSLAFACSDGLRDESQLSADQKAQRIRRVPDVLSFYSYMFYFHGIMVGPLAFYSDYMAFIEGTDVQQPPPASSDAANGYTDGVQSATAAPRDLKNVQATLKKLAVAAVCGVLMVTVPSRLCPPEGLLEEAFFEQTFIQRLLYVLVCTTVARQKYYFAWVLGETLNLAAGFGFNGFDSKGQPKWDLNENVSFWEVECATSLKTNIDGWNKKTLVWLRRVVYDRAPHHQTLAVFAVSAFWHGFYPGYYLTFGSAALFTIAARLVRRNVRPWFQTSEAKRQVYDAITFMFTRYANVYICFPFLTLELMSTLRIYASLFFWLHLLGIAAVVYFMFVAPSKRPSSRSQPVKQE
ncbi:lysophospholipid acyltransferase 6-like [Babylonia areolata]|uniref:lysophospholipid acyltransferase 6-like n=1 Tax=Babylonia areolata TaxID=304850 RepID=UPI003FCEEEB7